MRMLSLRCLFVVLLVALGGCRTPPVGFGIGKTGEASARLTCNQKVIEAKVVKGQLTVDGVDRGTVQPGDWVTLDWDGTVRVNGSARR